MKAGGERLAGLVPYPVDENSLRIGAGLKDDITGTDTGIHDGERQGLVPVQLGSGTPAFAQEDNS